MYIDDITLSEFLHEDDESKMSVLFNDVIQWSDSNNMNINIGKTKEMLIGSCKRVPDLICLNRADCIERVHAFKLLGVLINSSLKWNDHVNSICSKASSRLYFLKLLKRSGVYIPDLLLYYNSVIVPVIEYCCPAWHTSLTKEQSHHIESIQKRAFSIIFGMSLRGIYSDFCIANNLDTLADRRELVCKRFFSRSVIPESSCLHYLLPEQNDCTVIDKLRHKSRFNLLTVRTNRFRNSFILYALEHYL